MEFRYRAVAAALGKMDDKTLMNITPMLPIATIQ